MDKQAVERPLTRQPAGGPADLSPQAVSAEGAHQAQEVGITGTRWKPSEAQVDTLISALTGFREGGAVWQHNGDCVGADDLAGAIWRSIGGRVHLHPPSIRSKRAFQSFSIQSAAKPYLDRNRDIVDESGVLVAIPQEEFEQERSGTWATVRYARTLHRPIMVIWPSGRWTVENWPASVGTRPEGRDAVRDSADAPNPPHSSNGRS